MTTTDSVHDAAVISIRDAVSRTCELTDRAEAEGVYNDALRHGDYVMAATVAGVLTQVARRWATTQKAADYLGVTDRTIRTMITDGRIKAYRLGGRVVRVDLNEIDTAMEPFGGSL